MLGPESERDLSVQARAGDTEAMGRLVEANLRFVVRIAREYRGRGVPMEDLLSQGHLGIMEAVHRYDPDRGVRFTTYAVWWIRKAILHALQQQGLIRLSDHARRQAVRLRRTERQEERSVRQAETEPQALAPLPRCVNLDSDDGEGLPLGRRISDAAAPSPEALYLAGERRRLLWKAVRSLTPNERMILSLRFGLDGQECHSYGQIGRRFRLSHERIRQIECRVKTTLRRRLPPGLARDEATRLQPSNSAFTPDSSSSAMV